MAYDAEGLMLVQGIIGAVSGAAKKKFTYVTNDTRAVVEGAGYFNSAAALLNVGDIIEVSGDIDGTPFGAHYVVSSNDGSTVAVTLFTATAAA